MEYSIRAMNPIEHPMLEEFLYLAIFQEEGQPPLPREVIYQPAIYAYIEGFGTQPHDHCLCVQVGEEIIGAAWVRVMHGYGYVGKGVPELAISLYPQYRGMGLGTQLVKHMLDTLGQKGYTKLSLSVWKANPAWHMYQRLGFAIVQQTEREYLMEYVF